MEEKINIECDRMLDYFESLSKNGEIHVDPENAFKVCMGSIIGSILIGTR